jgi:uncharacterized protein (UPF0332 family)
LPTQLEHIAIAERNEAFASTVAKTTYYEWAITIFFYSALHYVDAILAVSGINPENHTSRGDAIGVNQTLLQVRKEYRRLETLSRNARYRALKIDSGDLQEAQNAFGTLRAHLRNRMKLL